MRRDIGYFFTRDVISVYNAYIAAANNSQFRRDCKQEPFHTITFGLNFSMKYNMNGGACIIHFMPYNGGTAVNIRFAIAQGFGARYEKYANDITNAAASVLGEAPTSASYNMDDFLRPENRIFASPQSFAPAEPAPQPIVPQPQPTVEPQIKPEPQPIKEKPSDSLPDSFCIDCGKKLVEGAPFCPNCGKRVLPLSNKKFCPYCGKEAESDALFCINCGGKF